jgi:hypothetical protein
MLSVGLINSLIPDVPKQGAFFTSGIGLPRTQLNNPENLTLHESD